MTDEYNLGGEMDEDKLNELYMSLQQDALPAISDDYGLMQPVSTVSETDNAHSAIDTKIMENDLRNLMTQSQNKNSGTIMANNEVKSGLGLLELIGGAGAAYGAGRAINPLFKTMGIGNTKNALSKLLSLFQNPKQVHKTIWRGAHGEIAPSREAFLGGYRDPSRAQKLLTEGAGAMKKAPIRKVGVTTGKATKNDPMWEALKYFDKSGNKIPPSRQLDFLLKK